MANKNKDFTNMTQEEAQGLILRYIRGDRLSTDETRVLSYLFAANPGLRKQVDGMRGGSASASRSNGARAESRGNLNRNLQTRGSGFGNNRVVSPGGFKKSGYDAESQQRMGLGGQFLTDPGNGIPPANLFADGSAYFNGKKYTKGEVDAIIKRGNTGATLGVGDQAVFDKYNFLKREMQVRAQAEESARRFSEQQNARQSDFKSQYKKKYGVEIPDDIILTDAEMDDLQRGNMRYGRSLRDIRDGVTGSNSYRLVNAKEDSEYRENLAKDEAARKDAERKAAMANADKRIKAGTHAYTQDQIRRMTDLQNEIEATNQDDDLDEIERASMVKDLENKLNSIYVNPHIRFNKEETNEESFKKSVYEDENGRKYIKDAKGNWRFDYDPNKEIADMEKKEEREKMRVDSERKSEEKERRSLKMRFMNDYAKQRQAEIDKFNETAADGEAKPNFVYDDSSIADMNDKWKWRERALWPDSNVGDQIPYGDDELPVGNGAQSTQMTAQPPKPMNGAPASRDWRTFRDSLSNGGAPVVSVQDDSQNVVETHQSASVGDVCLVCGVGHYGQDGVCDNCGSVIQQ